MIPRYKGLVPAIRGPAPANGSSASSSTTNAAKGPAASAVRTTVQRFVIELPPSAGAVAADAADPTTGEKPTGGSAEPERRLFSFLPSADCTAPPCELRVAARFFAEGVGEDAAVHSNGSAEDGSDDGDLDEVNGAEERGDRAAHRGAATAASLTTPTAGSGNGATRRRQRRVLRREPMRLEYDGFTTPSAKVAARTVRLASTPAPEFSRLSCVLLQLPAWWREGPPGQADDAAPEASPCASATVLRRPVLQLWGERNTSTVASAHVRTLLSASPSDGTGISSAWGSDTPVKISKKDWKTMDAADADLHRPTNWSDNDGSDDDGGGPGKDGVPLDSVSARARKRAREEATNATVRAFLAGTKEALRQQQGALGSEADGAPPSQPPPPPPPPPRAAAAGARDSRENNDRTPAATAAAVKVQPAPPVTPPVSTARRVISLSTPVVPTASGPAVTAAAATPASPQPPPPPSSPTQTSSGASTATAPASPLASLAAQVLAEMQAGEARASAPLSELQKRILKQLPDFAPMSVKMKSPATQQEAVTWLRTSQQALRMWLVEHGHSIAADGTVAFGAS